MLDTRIDSWYSDNYDEIDRLSINAVGRLELERTKELLLRFLPSAPARVLDVGGGPGVYASWLASLGYDVTLIDPVARHREEASVHGTFAVEDGDARALTAPDASADVVLMLGPLYHLVDPADRARALAEAGRVARPGGVVAAAFISRHAPIIDVSAKLLINDDALYEHLLRLRHSGDNDPGTASPSRTSIGSRRSSRTSRRPGSASRPSTGSKVRCCRCSEADSRRTARTTSRPRCARRARWRTSPPCSPRTPICSASSASDGDR
jgi:SAM-dependent methyltransferase